MKSENRYAYINSVVEKVFDVNREGANLSISLDRSSLTIFDRDDHHKIVASVHIENVDYAELGDIISDYTERGEYEQALYCLRKFRENLKKEEEPCG